MLIVMIILLIISLIPTVIGLWLLIGKVNGQKMNPIGASLILGIGLVLNILAGAGVFVGVNNNIKANNAKKVAIQKAELKRKQALILKQKKEKARQQQALMLKTFLPAEAYKLNPSVIYKMYNSTGQNSFDVNFDAGESKDYALKHIGLPLKGLTFRTTDDNIATIDNLAKNKRKIVLAIVPLQKDGTSDTDPKNDNGLISLIASLKANYPDVNFLTILPNGTQSDLNLILKNNNFDHYDEVIDQNMKGNVGDFGSLQDFLKSQLNYNGKPIFIAVDQNDRISMTEFNKGISSNNGSSDASSIMARFINLGFNTSEKDKIYHMLRSKNTINQIIDQGNTTYDSTDTKADE